MSSRVSLRKLFFFILTFVVLLACWGYATHPGAFRYGRPGADSADAAAEGVPTSSGVASAGTGVGSGAGEAATVEEEIIWTTTAAGHDRISSSNVSRETDGASPGTTTPVPTTAIHSDDARKTLHAKILKIQASRNCGTFGFKVDLDSQSDQAPDWAKGSTPIPSELTLPDPEPTAPYFVQMTSELQCYKKGTKLLETMTSPNVSECLCQPGYHGDDCGIPDPVWHSPDFKEGIHPYLSIRSTARRIIQAIPVNIELDLSNARVHELGEAVTATLFGEGDFTAAGERKDRFFERRAREDPSFLGPYRNRTILLRSNTFPPEGCKDGWASDEFSRSFIGKEGLQRLHGLRDDDFFLLFDADELPRKDVLDFLRFYEGYKEPIAFRMRWYVYGFFWETLKDKERVVVPTRIEAGCSVRMLRQVYDGNPYAIRQKEWLDEAIEKARKYELSVRRRLDTFEIGSRDHPGGFHCSWCFRDFEGLQIKLVSAQLSDGPRWGSMADHLQPDYLRRVVREGEWFDGQRNFAPRNVSSEADEGGLKDFAPSYLLRNFDEYSYFFVNPSQRQNRTLMEQYRKAIERKLLDPRDGDQR